MKDDKRVNISNKIKMKIKYTYEKMIKKFNELSVKIKTVNKYQSFSPKTNIKSNNTTIKMLKEAIKNKKNKNIAISGKYGSGKTSIIKSLFNKKINRLKYKPLFISLGMFETSVETEEIDKFSQQIEKSIIQQILYTEKSDNLPDSNVSRVGKIRARHYVSVIFILLLVVSSLLIKKITFENFTNAINEFIGYTMLAINNKQWLTLFILGIVSIISITILICFIIWFFTQLAMIVKNFKIRNIVINLKSTKIDLSAKKEESLINKYLDELVYFFSTTNYKVVIIEDLDRFINNNIENTDSKNKKRIEEINKKILMIFQKLKELNEILNNSKEINRRICFVYAVKDNLFKNQYERTKFFDFIVPVIPILSTYNSYAELEKQVSKRRIEINKSVLLELSSYIGDYRLMSSIINEYVLYQRALEKDELDNNKLFALIVLKNIEPEEFDLLMEDKGNIYNTIKKQSEIISSIQRGYLEKISLNKQHIKEVKEENLKALKELKLILLGTLHEKSANSYNNGKMTVDEFLDDSTTRNVIANQKIEIRISGKGTYTESLIFKEIEKSDFLKRAELIEDKYNREQEKLELENIKLLNEINEIRRKNLKELLNNKEIDLNDIKGMCNDFEFNLILNGYIDENYKDYMFKFKESELIKKKDNLFIYNNTSNKPTAFDYTLNNAEIVVNMLEEKFFGIENILNFDIVTFLLNNNDKKYENKTKELFKLLNGENSNYNEDIIMRFIYDYISRDSKYYKLLEQLNEYNRKIIFKILEYYNEKSIEKADEIIKILLRCPELSKEQNVEKIIRNRLIEIENLDTWIELDENVKKSLILLSIKFENLNNRNKEETIDFIYENNLYLLNADMIKIILIYKGYSEYTFNTKNLSTIITEKKLLKMKEYVLNNKEEYIKLCYLKTNNSNEEVTNIINLINNWDINIELKEEIIKNSSVQLQDITNIESNNYYNFYFKYNKLKVSWKNIYNYYLSLGMKLTKEIIIYIENNIDEIMSIENEDVSPDISNMYVAIAKDNNINFEVYKTLIPKFKVIIEDINTDEIDEGRLRILVLNKMVKFNIDNFNVISKELLELLDYYIMQDIDKFIENINDFDVDDEIINVILKSDKIKFKYKTKIIQTIDIDLLNEDSLEYIVNNYNRTKIAKIKAQIKEKIFISEVAIIYKIKFLNIELDIETSDERVKKYLKLIGQPYELIGEFELKNTTFSIPKYDDSLDVLKKLQQKGFLFTYKEHRETITINNKKSEV